MNQLRALLVVFDDWYSTARLPETLHKAGFEVGLLSEGPILAAQTLHASRRFALDVEQVRRGRLASVLAAVDTFMPDIIVPGDERALRLVLFLATARAAQEMPALQRLARRSVGAAAASGLFGDRASMLDLATKLGIACSRYARVWSAQQAAAFGERHGWPVFLKRDQTYGGQGVRLCADAAAVRAAYRQFTRGHDIRSPLGLWRRGRRWIEARTLGDNPTALPIGIMGITVEAAVPGQPAFYTAVALDGRPLAGLSAEVEAFHPPPTGPSTRVRIRHDETMEEMARELVEALGYSGFYGLDFIRQPDGKLIFLEFNSRPTTIAHLGGLISADLGAALSAALRGQPVPPANHASEVRVALFPQDWIRDPQACDRDKFYLDVPQDDPQLLAALASRLPAGVDKSNIEALSRRPT